jgi:thiol-disulfide isomerase/thioredoxin
MKTGKHLIGTILTLAVACLAAQGETRTWTSTAGTMIEAEFVKVKFDTVYLRTADGETKKIPKSKLVKADQLLVTKLDNPFANKAGETVAEGPKASSAIHDLFGKELTNSRKKKVSVDALAGKTIGIYFSAHWCPPCRTFTPMLVDFHNEMTKQGKPFEIVFVSSDRDKAAMFSYMKETDMPWLALPFGDDHKQELSKKFKVSGIPKLVIVDEKGNLITGNGRGDVSSKGEDAFDGWD